MNYGKKITEECSLFLKCYFLKSIPLGVTICFPLEAFAPIKEIQYLLLHLHGSIEHSFKIVYQVQFHIETTVKLLVNGNETAF